MHHPTFVACCLGSSSALCLAAVVATACAGDQRAPARPALTADPPPVFHSYPDIAPDLLETRSPADAGSAQATPDAGPSEDAASQDEPARCNHLDTPPPAPPAPPARRRVRSGPPITNHIPPELVMRPIRGRAACLSDCYEQGLASDPNLQGRVEIRFVIDEDGWVRRATVYKSDLGDPRVAECIARELVGLKFPDLEGGKITIVYPFTLGPDPTR
jgi:hypothetical protein